ncbi:MAG: hypothetical protein U9Q21_02100 [Candidatus Auribacterota bacterium]|nr:hypothetical protein [Candidatus Auribacterota bacterium]
MFKTVIKLTGCVIISLFLTSCASLKSKHYVGIKEPIEKEDLEEESIWQFEDKVFYVRALDPATAIASSLKWDDSKKEYKIITTQVVLTKLDEHLFLNLKGEKEDLYTILRLTGSMDGTMIIFTVDDEEIEKHIKEGKVKAIKKGDNFILELTKEELDSYVRENLNNLFDYDIAGIIKPLKGFKEKE